MNKDRKNISVCVVDDEEIIRVSLSDELKDWGCMVHEFGNPVDALQFIKYNDIDVVITDIKMPEMDGITLLKEVKRVKPKAYVIMMTAYGSVKSAVEAIKIGAYDYLVKPYDTTELESLVDKIVELTSLRRANIQFSTHFQNKYNLASFTGQSESVIKLREQIKLIANKNTTVLLHGETGTGKELLANVIHYESTRSNKPLVKVSCAILSKDVFESELFGHEKGSFTGAEKERIGRFEQADEGTIFLDDIDDIPLELQVKLLRVLQEGEIERVGGNKTIKVDVRVLASTKVELKELVKRGNFREDLFYRLNVFPIKLHPLRERKSDIPLLLNEFLKEFSSKKESLMQDKVYRILEKYNWPGNTRELKNLVERLTIIASDGVISLENLPYEYCAAEVSPSNIELDKKNLAALVSDFEIRAIRLALTKSNGNKNKAAELLSIPISTLRSKMEKYCL